MRISVNTAADLFSWFVGVLKKIAGIFSLRERPCVDVPPKEAEKLCVVKPEKGSENRVWLSRRRDLTTLQNDRLFLRDVLCSPIPITT